MSAFVRSTCDLVGVLQGVGFRPTMARLVAATDLRGWVRNQSGTVRLVLEGTPGEVSRFLKDLPAGLPRQARLDSIQEISREVIAEEQMDPRFVILESFAGDETRISIPADLASCSDCVAEIFSPESRYYGYPFTTCTNCGPRYTVVDAMPYDRERTALGEFPLCDQCLAEYREPLDRRFHAESIACPKCGPRLVLLDGAGKKLEGDALVRAREELARGSILAVRGLGGYLLAADPVNDETLRRLRNRKKRPHKPFALMARDIGVAGEICELSQEMARLMDSEISPIAISRIRDGVEERLPMDLIAPDTRTLGVMLPTTPLHHLLATPLPGDPTPAFDLLVMTSGNRGGEPICLSNEEALERLAGIADFFLCHDRNVNLRNDDSLAVIMDGVPQVWRRARGYAPEPVVMKRDLSNTVLAMGAELKNTLALGYDREVILSPHIGDLETPEALDGLETVLRRFPGFFGKTPSKVAVDLHPDMRATTSGREYAREVGASVVTVQHHHAHAASCMAEHGLSQALALVFDGTGLGTDGTIWGAELLHVRDGDFARLGTFAPVPLPGGDAAVRNPARQVVARWHAAGIDVSEERLNDLKVTESEAGIWRLQCDQGLNAPLTHAAGRVFDSYSALLGLAPSSVTYEGQAAIVLETAAGRARGEGANVPCDVRREGDLLLLDWAPAFEALARRRPEGREILELALGFHAAAARAAVDMAAHGRELTGCDDVVLSGGVMMNRIVCESLAAHLRNQKFSVFLQRLVPPNDGGISLGQAAIAGGLV